ncbi:Protein of unknown function (DUF4246) domain containing protein [Rhypophila decipiens]
MEVDFSAFDNSGSGPIKVPGFNGLDQYVEGVGSDGTRRFIHALDNPRHWPMRATAREIAMLRCMERITDKPRWHRDIFVQDILSEWRVEAINADWKISDKAWTWCVQELQDKARDFVDTGRVVVLDYGAARVCKFDLTDELTTLLQSTVTEVGEREPRKLLPGSDGVAHIVDPHLAPLMYGWTKVLSKGGVVGMDDVDAYNRGDRAPEAWGSLDPIELEGEGDPWANAHTIARRQQVLGYMFEDKHWLPCEVSFSTGTTTRPKVNITSYINDLHPHGQAHAYAAMEQAVSVAVESWNDVLIRAPDACKYPYSNSLAVGRTPARIKTYGAQYHPEPGVSFTFQEWKAGENVDRAIVPKHAIEPDEEFEPYSVSIQNQFRERGLQVVVQIDSIELNPSLPPPVANSEPYTWHSADSQATDYISATSIVFFDLNNIEPFRICFQQPSHLEKSHFSDAEQGDFRGMREVFDLGYLNYRAGDRRRKDRHIWFQDLGSVEACKGRMVSFPGPVSYRFDRSKLVDPSKPGRARYLTLHLVDPNYRVCSTRNVPPQRLDWWAHDVARRTHFELPQELYDMVIAKVAADLNSASRVAGQKWPMFTSELLQGLGRQMLASRLLNERSVRSYILHCPPLNQLRHGPGFLEPDDEAASNEEDDSEEGDSDNEEDDSEEADYEEEVSAADRAFWRGALSEIDELSEEDMELYFQGGELMVLDDIPE